MAVDYFNNQSNDYINPALPVCPGVADGNGTFEFIPKRSLGVISGGDIMASIDFTDFSQTVTGWTKERKTIQPGEVVFIQGLSKGISYRSLVFPITQIDVSSDSGYYIHVDMSIGYYKNFRYTVTNVSTNGDFDSGIDIGNALDIALGDLNISVNAASYLAIDVSQRFVFIGSLAGYDFDVTNFQYILNSSTHLITSDPLQEVVASKYPNSGMLGYVLKVIFPSISTVASAEYLNLKHIPTTLTYYEASTGSGFVEYTKTVDAGNNISTDEIMSAGDFLNYIDVNELWEKVGQLKVWFSAEDPESNSNTTNLLTGFYLYNSETFPIMIEYMVMI